MPDLMKLEDYISNQKKGAVFTSVEYTKKGKPRGRGENKKIFGDDRSKLVMITGFSYLALCERSVKVLDNLSNSEILTEAHERDLRDSKTGELVGPEDVLLAREELRESLVLSSCGENKATHDHVFEQLIVDDKPVRGSKVYLCTSDLSDDCRCRECNPEDRKAPVPGSIYLSGLMISQKVIIPAKNGPVPPSKSSAKVIAKKLMRKRLPVSRFVTLTLLDEQKPIIKLGGLERVEVV